VATPSLEVSVPPDAPMVLDTGLMLGWGEEHATTNASEASGRKRIRWTAIQVIVNDRYAGVNFGKPKPAATA